MFRCLSFDSTLFLCLYLCEQWFCCFRSFLSSISLRFRSFRDLLTSSGESVGSGMTSRDREWHQELPSRVSQQRDVLIYFLRVQSRIEESEKRVVLLDWASQMASVSSKSKEHAEELIIEEESGTIKRTVEQVSPSQQEHRKRTHESSHESPSKYRQSSDGNRTAVTPPTTTTSAREHSLSVPFWKQLNGSHASSQCETRQIGCFSLLKRTDDKECFDDKRYLRGKESVSLLSTN